jgi:hypothetical protein
MDVGVLVVLVVVIAAAVAAAVLLLLSMLKIPRWSYVLMLQS